MTVDARRLGLLGGTFDPVHFGHLDAADAARAALALDEIWLIPSNVPPHRQGPVATPFHRFALAALAVATRSDCRVSDIELRRTGPTYTVDTLRYLHGHGWAPTQLFFILGSDAFAEIATWHEFPHVLDAAHFVVIARRGTTLDAAVSRTPQLRSRVGTPDILRASGTDTRIIVVPTDTRDVSATAIRHRRQVGDAINGLVPDAVAHHIVGHHLYEAVDNLHGETVTTF